MIQNSGRCNPPPCDDIEADVRPVEESCPDHQQRPQHARNKLPQLEEEDGEKRKKEKRNDGKQSVRESKK